MIYIGGPLDGQTAPKRKALYRKDDGAALVANQGDSQMWKVKRGEPLTRTFYIQRTHGYVHSTHSTF